MTIKCRCDVEKNACTLLGIMQVIDGNITVQAKTWNYQHNYCHAPFVFAFCSLLHCWNFYFLFIFSQQLKQALIWCRNCSSVNDCKVVSLQGSWITLNHKFPIITLQTWHRVLLLNSCPCSAPNMNTVTVLLYLSSEHYSKASGLWLYVN